MSERALRAILLFVGAYHLLTGALALVAPGTFFDEIGRYGAENLHYVGDVGAFTAAAGIGLIAAAYRPSWRAPILWVGAAWYGLHALNHAFDTDEARSTARGVADTVLLALGGLGSAYLARVAERLQAGTPHP
jgi:predicted anti-sigma-YlaC factor YlaD